MPLNRSSITSFLSSCNLIRQLQLLVNQILVSGRFPYRHRLCFDITHMGPVLLTLRTYALYNCSIRILSFMIGIATVLAGIASVRYVYSSHPRVICSRFSQWTLFGQKSVNSQVILRCDTGLSRITYVYLDLHLSGNIAEKFDSQCYS